MSEKSFLVSYAHDYPGRKSYAAYYIDVWGNKELIHRDTVMDVLCPMPVRQRPRPPMLPSHVGSESTYAICYLDDVNRDMPGVKPGTVRYIRISEQLQWFFGKNDNTGPIRWTPGTQHSRNFGYWSWSPTRVIGTVPVETDGSAYFKVPTGLAVYFQALDENLMEIRRMRSHVEFKPGELRGCVGCHETKEHVPRANFGSRQTGTESGTLAAQAAAVGRCGTVGLRAADSADLRPALRSVSQRDRSADGPRPHRRPRFLWLRAILSVFVWDQEGHADSVGRGIPRSIRGHAATRAGGRCTLRSGRRTIYTPGGLLCLSNHMSGPEVTQPKQFGSHRSRLVLTLLNDETHQKEVDMNTDEWETLVTWVDANAPYYSTYFQYFDAQGKALPTPMRVRVELDPPFKAGEKSCRIVADKTMTNDE